MFYVLTPNAAPDKATILAICLAIVLAGAIGFIEDLRGLSASTRAVWQLLIGGAAGVALVSIHRADLGWVWFIALIIASYINVANFMDGVNGISGLHGAVAGIWFACVGLLTGEPWLVSFGGILAAAFTAFLPLNLMRPGLFLGDVGSYVLGASVSMAALAAVMVGIPFICAVAPMVIYVADTAATFASRLLRGERWFEAHRSHIYQQLVQLGMSHVSVAVTVSAFTAACCVIAGLTLATPIEAWPVAFIGLLLLALAYLALPAAVRAINHRFQRAS